MGRFWHHNSTIKVRFPYSSEPVEAYVLEENGDWLLVRVSDTGSHEQVHISQVV